jgi:hypothetical protein
MYIHIGASIHIHIHTQSYLLLCYHPACTTMYVNDNTMMHVHGLKCREQPDYMELVYVYVNMYAYIPYVPERQGAA